MIRLLNAFLAVTALTLGLAVAGCDKGGRNKVVPGNATVYEADIEIAPGRKATFKLKGVKLAIPEMEGDYVRGGGEVISNVLGDASDTVEVQVVAGTKPGKAVLKLKEYEEDAGKAGRVVALITINVKGQGLPRSSMTMVEPLSLAREVEVEQGKEAIVDIWNGRAKSATTGKEGLSVLVEGTGGKSGKGFVKLTASKDAMVGEQKVSVKADEARYPSDEAESGMTSTGTVELTVRIKPAQ